MNYLSKFPILILALALTTLNGCLQDECDAEQTYTRYDPIYVAPTDIRQDIAIQESVTLENPGKIYYYKNYLLINEFEKGIHFYDNSNPASPQSLAFLPIDGNVDMAIRNDHLYADNYVDLLTFDISDPLNPVLVDRIEEEFFYYGFEEDKGYIVGYEPTSETRTISCQENFGDMFWDGPVLFATAEANFNAVRTSNSSTPSGSNVGTGGSLARFTIAKDHLYMVSEYDLKVFDLEVPDDPRFITVNNIGWGIETIFPYQDNLFIGSRNGMFIMSIEEPGRPFMQGVFWHSNACDPVYVDGDYAYVTLRDGTECETFTNQLDVVDIRDLQNPLLVKSFEMHNPMGISVFEEHLFLCDNDEGLKIFDATDPNTVGDELVKRINDFDAFDVITLKEERVALVIGPDGFYQYDIDDPRNPIFLSKINVDR